MVGIAKGVMMKISDEVANILANSTVDGNNLYLPQIQLERGMYLAVNKVLNAIGGKWNRKAKAHIFDESPVDTIEQILLIGEYTDAKKEFQFFETPDELAEQLVEMADIRDGETVLEPSAGRGQIAKYINEKHSCDCIELNDSNRKYLLENGFYLVGDDFLKCTQRYDVIIANPPFSRQQDIDHVLHMIKLANRRVVSVMSSAVLFRDNKKTVAFREIVSNIGGTMKKLPEKTFSKSGTNVNVCVLCVDI